MNEEQEYVRARVVVSGTASDSDDHFLPGDYPVVVHLTRAIAPEALGEGSKSEIAKAVLDLFHEKHAIACLEDFNIEVVLETGAQAYELDDHASSGLVRQVEPAW